MEKIWGKCRWHIAIGIWNVYAREAVYWVQVPEESVLDDYDCDTLMELGPGWDLGYRRVQTSVGIQVPEEESPQGTALSEPGITKEQGCSESSTGEAFSVMTEDQTQSLVRQLVVVDKAAGDREAFLDGTESNFMAQVSLDEWHNTKGVTQIWDLRSSGCSQMSLLHKQIWHCRARLPNISGCVGNSSKGNKACYFTNEIIECKSPYC